MQKTVKKLDTLKLVMPKIKRVAAYARVSSGKEAMLHSLSAQVSYYCKLIQDASDWEYAGVYKE
nr:MAG TPA: integrase [Caudoviricetes sp.]